MCEILLTAIFNFDTRISTIKVNQFNNIPRFVKRKNVRRKSAIPVLILSKKCGHMVVPSFMFPVTEIWERDVRLSSPRSIVRHLQSPPPQNPPPNQIRLQIMALRHLQTHLHFHPLKTRTHALPPPPLLLREGTLLRKRTLLVVAKTSNNSCRTLPEPGLPL